MKLIIRKHPDGRVRIARNFLRLVDLTPDELHQVAQYAPPAWPDGFVERLQTACGALLQFRDRLADSGPPVSLLTSADAAIDLLGNLVSDFGIHQTEAPNDQTS